MKNTFSLILFICLSYQSTAQMTILPVFGDKPITENTWYITKNGDSIQLDNVRFYMSNIQFETIDNQIVRDNVKAYLIDIFEPNSLKIALPNVDFSKIKKLHFDIGIDSLTNVSGAFGGDLDPQRGMYWAWQSGYVNLKIEGRSPQCKSRKNAFQFHIGGYLPPFYALKHIELPINVPNIEQNTPKKTVGTEGFALTKDEVILTIDFAHFFNNINIATQKSIMIPCKEAVQLADYIKVVGKFMSR